tara:strand:+ start:3791 stop:4258 length:468 start_codon:yes stop_codon:yes gene_type:complete
MDKNSLGKSKVNKALLGATNYYSEHKRITRVKSRHKKWAKDQQPGAGNKRSKYTSSKTHYSPTDPDARISVKPGKVRKLNYMGQLSVDKKDNQYLQEISNRLQNRLWKSKFIWENLVADTGYSSGEYYVFLESKDIESFIAFILFIKEDQTILFM